MRLKALVTRGISAAVRFTALSLLFALLYAQSPLYTSNQHQYFLHGLARAGVGELREDWLANTRDPTPVFTWLVEGTARSFGPAAFPLEYAILMGVYFVSLVSILDSAGLVPSERRGRAILAIGLLAVHSAAFRFVLARGLGPDWSFVFESGVAGQRLLGQVFQPSSFGVLLLASLAAFLRGRSKTSVALAALAATIHPTYLLCAAALVLTYCLALARGAARPLSVVELAGLALLLVLPILAYTALTFSSSGPENFRLAQEILVARIPHHAVPAKWLDPPVALQLALLGAALLASRGPRLFLFLALPAAISFVLTGAQLLSGSTSLALLFPWRISVLLIPLSTAILVARAVPAVTTWLARVPPRLAGAGAAALLLALAAAGAARFVLEAQSIQAEAARPMFEFVAAHLQPGEVYLTPPKLDGFRLATGAPIVADSKSIPYFDREVLEWNDRLRLAQFFYRDRVEYIDCDVLEQIRARYRPTHLVLGPQQLGANCGPWQEVYRDASYAVYRLPEP